MLTLALCVSSQSSTMGKKSRVKIQKSGSGAAAAVSPKEMMNLINELLQSKSTTATPVDDLCVDLCIGRHTENYWCFCHSPPSIVAVTQFSPCSLSQNAALQPPLLVRSGRSTSRSEAWWKRFAKNKKASLNNRIHHLIYCNTEVFSRAAFMVTSLLNETGHSCKYGAERSSHFPPAGGFSLSSIYIETWSRNRENVHLSGGDQGVVVVLDEVLADSDSDPVTMVFSGPVFSGPVTAGLPV